MKLTGKEGVVRMKRSDERAAQVNTQSGLATSAVLLGVGQIGQERMRSGMDDDIGHRHVHPLVFDGYPLVGLAEFVVPTLELIGESETFGRSGRFGHQNGDPVPLKTASSHVVQLLRRAAQHVLDEKEQVIFLDGSGLMIIIIV